MTLDDFLVDKRTVQRHLKDGRLDTADYQRMLDALPDQSGSIWRKPALSESPSPIKVLEQEQPTAAPL